MRRIISLQHSLLPVVLLIWTTAVGAQPSDKDEFGDQIDVTFPREQPASDGLILPKGDPIPGRGRRVMLVDRDEQLVVGRIHVEVHDEQDGTDTYVVLLPDGRLRAVKKNDTIETDRPFRSISIEDLLEQLASNDFQGFESRSTTRFLYVYNTTAEFAGATAAILEMMYPAVCQFCQSHGLDVREPEFPLVVVMFNDREQFDRYRKMPAGTTGYYNVVSNQLVLYSDADLAKVSPELALKIVTSTIAHEAAHQILCNIGVAQRLATWPLWFDEGLAEYFAPTETGNRLRYKGLGLVHDLRMHELVQRARSTKSIGTNWFGLQKTVDAKQLDSLGYAVSWATIYVLANSRHDEFRSFLQEVSKLQPMETATPGVLFRKHFGDNFVKNEQEIVAALRQVNYATPTANPTYYVAIAEITDKGLSVGMSVSPRAILEWRDQQTGLQRFAIKPFPNKSVARLYIASLKQRK